MVRVCFPLGEVQIMTAGTVVPRIDADRRTLAVSTKNSSDARSFFPRSEAAASEARGIVGDGFCLENQMSSFPHVAKTRRP